MTAALEDIQIDERVRPLVEALNCIPSVFTISSCEGHKNPNKAQVDANTFYVDFGVRRRGGLDALSLIARVCGEFRGLELTAWYDGGLRWDLRGHDIDPEEVAEAIWFMREDGEQPENG
jgi:hypothetical protein